MKSLAAFSRTLTLQPRARVIFLAALVLTTLFLFAIASSASVSKGFSSAEVKFADFSSSGLSIIPASCPSSPHYAGQCSGGPTCPDGSPRLPSGYCPRNATCPDGSPMPPSGVCPGGPGGNGGGGGGGGAGGCDVGYERNQSGSCVSCSSGGGSDNGVQGGACTSCTSVQFCSGSTLYYQNANCSWGVSKVCSNGCSQGQCVASCTDSYFCSGSSLYHKNAQCVNTLVEACTYGCLGSSCSPPPPATLNLNVHPTLIRRGDRVSVEWSTQQTQSCTVTGTNGDSWSGTAGTQTSNPITARTVYTLACTGLDGGHPSRSATVNIIFTFDEQ